MNSLGYWEHNHYILMRTETDESFAEKHQLSLNELQSNIHVWKQKLLAERNKRIRPGLDDKILASWNAMTISGLVSCYKAFGEPEYLELALSNAYFLKQKMISESGEIFHSYKNSQAKISGFLEDYAFIIEAFTSLFEVTGGKHWLDDAQQLAEFTLQQFFDEQKSIFYFTSNEQQNLITRTIEIHDNVIPSSNSAMARNMLRLSYLLDRPDYLNIAQKMLDQISRNLIEYPSGYSNWAQLLLDLTTSHFEVAIIGERALEILSEIQKNYFPNVVFCAGTSEDKLPLLKKRSVPGKTLIYICQNNSCQLPVETVAEAIALILKIN